VAVPRPHSPPAGTVVPVRRVAPEARIQAARGPLDRAMLVSSMTAFAEAFGHPARPTAGAGVPGGVLAHAVRGFFENGGKACWVARVPGSPGQGDEAGHLGTGATPAGLALLRAIPGPLVLAAPDAYLGSADAAVGDRIQRAFAAAAAARPDGTAILCTPPGLEGSQLGPWRAALRVSTAAAALYHPWIRLTDGPGDVVRTVPPVGHVAGVWARTEHEAGLARAPTGVRVRGADQLAGELTRRDQQPLQQAGVNVLRSWPEGVVHLWGARTMGGEDGRRYVHEHRIAAHLARSITDGTRWVLDAPLSDAGREVAQHACEGFLTGAWTAGLLHGTTAGQAYTVRSRLREGANGTTALEINLSLTLRADRRRTIVTVVHEH
jgi:hypothetical protein